MKSRCLTPGLAGRRKSVAIQLIVGGDTLRKLETKSDYLKSQVVGNLGERRCELHKKPKVKETNYTPEKATWLLPFWKRWQTRVLENETQMPCMVTLQPRVHRTNLHLHTRTPHIRTHTHTHIKSCLIWKEACQPWMKSILNGLEEAAVRVWELVAGDLALVADVEQDQQQHHPSLHWMSFPSMASVLASVTMTTKVTCSAATSPLSFSPTYPMSTLCLHKDGTRVSQHPHVQIEPVIFPHTWSSSRMPVRRWLPHLFNCRSQNPRVTVHASCALLCLVAQLCLTLCDPMDCSPPGSSVHGDSLGKNTGVDCHALLQGIFPTQWSNPGLLHWQADSLLFEPPNCWIFSIKLHQSSPSSPFCPLIFIHFLPSP